MLDNLSRYILVSRDDGLLEVSFVPRRGNPLKGSRARRRLDDLFQAMLHRAFKGAL
jgi:hypothetical protein